MASNLNYDVLRLVFEELADEPSQLLESARVSKKFLSIVTPLIYRCIVVRACLDPERRHVTRALLTRLSTNTALRSFIREVMIVDKGDERIPFIAQKRLLTLIPRLKYFKISLWICHHFHYPELLAKLVQIRCNVELHLTENSSHQNQDPTLPPSIRHSLRSLHIAFPIAPDYVGFRGKAVTGLFRILPKLESLRTLHLIRDDVDTYEYMGFQLPPVYRQPFSFKAVDRRGSPQLHDLSIDNDILLLSELRWWAENGNWSQLQRIRLRDTVMLPWLTGCEQTLRSITLSGSHRKSNHNLSRTCCRFGHIENLNLIGRPGEGDFPYQIVKTFGESIRKLQFRSGHSTRSIELSDLSAIHESCPQLRSLAVNMEPNTRLWVSLHSNVPVSNVS